MSVSLELALWLAVAAVCFLLMKRYKKLHDNHRPSLLKKIRYRKKKAVFLLLLLIVMYGVCTWLLVSRQEISKVSIIRAGESPDILAFWVVSAIVLVLSIIFRLVVVPRLKTIPEGIQNLIEFFADIFDKYKKSRLHGFFMKFDYKKKSGLFKILFLISIYAAGGRLLKLIYGTQEKEKLNVMLFAPKINLHGFEISQSIYVFWIVMLVVLILAVAFRVFAVPRFRDTPRGIQNLIELSIDAVSRYAKGLVHDCSDALACYMFTVAVALLGSSAVELFSVRPPTADLVDTFSLAIVTFILINYYGIKIKGVKGRIKSLAKPTPIILPIKILTDFAIPVSLACRLFGNMIGGMIVMDLLKSALGVNGLAIPAFAGLFFNLFHPAIQTYIFITLSLTFIGEATE